MQGWMILVMYNDILVFLLFFLFMCVHDEKPFVASFIVFFPHATRCVLRQIAASTALGRYVHTIQLEGVFISPETQRNLPM